MMKQVTKYAAFQNAQICFFLPLTSAVIFWKAVDPNPQTSCFAVSSVPNKPTFKLNRILQLRQGQQIAGTWVTFAKGRHPVHFLHGNKLWIQPLKTDSTNRLLAFCHGWAQELCVVDV